MGIVHYAFLDIAFPMNMFLEVSSISTLIQNYMIMALRKLFFMKKNTLYHLMNVYIGSQS
jgi:hypothetical protein